MKFHPLLKWGLLAGGLVCFILVAAFVALLVYVLHTQRAYAALTDTHNLREQIKAMGADYLMSHPKAAVVIAFYQRGQESVQGFGTANGADPPDAQTIFEIGSVTKTFTAAMLSEMVADGSMKLDDPISLYLPKGVVSPTKNGREITLENLATHTSGLPRLPDNFFAVVTNQQNPYISYTTKDLYDSLATVQLRTDPGKTSDYSNYGFGLLGKILELKTGKSYETLLQEDICAPLGMENTTTQLSAGQRQRLTPGHDSKGNVVSNWDFDALAGCGAIRSDATDMLKYIEANLGKATPKLLGAMEADQAPHYTGLTGIVGLGWQITKTVEGPTIIWHNGGTGGYRSFVGFDKEHQVGIVVLSNYGDAITGDSSIDRIGMKLLTLGTKVSLQ